MNVTVNVDLPTDNNDCLAGTALDPIPGRGVLALYLASSQRDGIVSVQGPAIAGANATYRIPPVLRASGIPDLAADMPNLIPVKAGKLAVVYDEVTAGDAFLTAIYVGE